MARTVSPGVIKTARLDLVPLALPIAAAIVAGARPPGARWALGYPTEATLVGASLIVTAEGTGRSPEPYGAYQVVDRETGIIVGDCGFEGPPNDESAVHVAVGIALGQRRRGYAREALEGLIRWARDRGDVERVTADTARTNADLISVLEGAGMRRYHEDESLVYYEA